MVMSAWIPEGWRSVTPRIVVRDVPAQIDFLRRVFGATGELESERPSVITIGRGDVARGAARPSVW
jgi:hypothetical protein